MIYKKIAAKLRDEINSHNYMIGDTFPSEKSLIQAFSVSRMTIRRAINELIALKLLEKKQGIGTFVIAKDQTFEVAELKSFREIMHESNHHYRTEVIDFQIVTAPLAITSKLNLSLDSKVLYSRRIRYVNDRPIIVEDSYMPFVLFKDLSIAHLERSKFDYIENSCRIQIMGSYEACKAIIADEKIASLLNIKPITPILLISTLSYDSHNQFVNYAFIYQNTNEHSYQYHLKRAKNNLPAV